MPDDPTANVPPEISAFLRDRARSLDADAMEVTLEEAMDRPVAARHGFGWRRGAVPMGPSRRGAPALAAAAVAAVLIAGVVGFAAGRGSAPKPTVVSAADQPPANAPGEAASSQGFAFATTGQAIYSSSCRTVMWLALIFPARKSRRRACGCRTESFTLWQVRS